MILSGNDIEHALLGLAALYVGIPYAPISPAYSLISGDFGKLRSIIELLTPGLVFACDGNQFAQGHRSGRARRRGSRGHAQRRRQAGARPRSPISTSRTPTAAVDAAHDAVGPDTIAKFLFTSGSTGMPKGVITTQRMWCSNQEMMRQALGYFADEPPVIVDWAPWHHTAGGNHDVGLVLYNGGTFYIDDGKPVPGAIEETVQNLREIAPTWYFTVPKGYEALLPYLRNDAELRRNFFSRLKLFWFAGAGIAQHVFDEIQELARRDLRRAHPVPHRLRLDRDRALRAGAHLAGGERRQYGPAGAGMELKLVPNEGKLEARVRGPNITPGYWRQPRIHREGLRRGRLLPARRRLQVRRPRRSRSRACCSTAASPRTSSSSTGTWVNVGPLRAGFIDIARPTCATWCWPGATATTSARWSFPISTPAASLRPICRRMRRPKPCSSDTRVRAISPSG